MSVVDSESDFHLSFDEERFFVMRPSLLTGHDIVVKLTAFSVCGSQTAAAYSRISRTSYRALRAVLFVTLLPILMLQRRKPSVFLAFFFVSLSLFPSSCDGVDISTVFYVILGVDTKAGCSADVVECCYRPATEFLITRSLITVVVCIDHRCFQVLLYRPTTVFLSLDH